MKSSNAGSVIMVVVRIVVVVVLVVVVIVVVVAISRKLFRRLCNCVTRSPIGSGSVNARPRTSAGNEHANSNNITPLKYI